MLKKLNFLLGLFSVFCLSGLLAAQERGLSIESAPVENTAGTKYAILIGVNDYENIRSLSYAKNDTEALRNQLIAIGFEPGNIETLVCGGATKNLPTKRRIETVISGVLNRAKEGDFVLLSMSGHGIEVEGKAQFCPMDTDPDDMTATTIPIKDIFAMLEQSKASLKLMIVDACRDNPFLTRSVRGVSVLPTIPSPPEGIWLLQSSSPGEQSWEDDEIKRGIFTHYLVEGLGGKAADSDGKVTFLGLSKYASDATQHRVFGKHRKEQRPYYSGKGRDPVIVPPKSSNHFDTSPKPQSGERQPGERMVLIINQVEYPFRWCPPGEFDRKSLSGNDPEHVVKISRGFWMLETEVTQRMWKSFMNSNPSGLIGISTERPVESVSWADCQDYIAQLNSTNWGEWKPDAFDPSYFRFSLPTEAQWEYACRAGTTTAYHTGEKLTKVQANIGGNPSGTVNVKSYPDNANAWGLYDMHGNVSEWCLDSWREKYPGVDVTDPLNDTPHSRRVHRGGNYDTATWGCQSASRSSADRTSKSKNIGLRLVLVAK